jgi:hypothetical protein
MAKSPYQIDVSTIIIAQLRRTTGLHLVTPSLEVPITHRACQNARAVKRRALAMIEVIAPVREA